MRRLLLSLAVLLGTVACGDLPTAPTAVRCWTEYHTPNAITEPSQYGYKLIDPGPLVAVRVCY